jgi:excisionase family DNA binding protein
VLSVRETADMLGVTEKTVRRLIAAGRLPALQLGPPGSSIRIPEDELRPAPRLFARAVPPGRDYAPIETRAFWRWATTSMEGPRKRFLA